MIFIGDNILVPEVIQAMYKVHKSVDELVTPGNFYLLVNFLLHILEKLQINSIN